MFTVEIEIVRLMGLLAFKIALLARAVLEFNCLHQHGNYRHENTRYCKAVYREPDKDRNGTFRDHWTDQEKCHNLSEDTY